MFEIDLRGIFFGLTSLSLSLFVSLLRSTQIKTYSWDNAQVILVGNKCDMEDERVIFTERGKHLAEQLGKKRNDKSFMTACENAQSNVINCWTTCDEMFMIQLL